MSVYTLRAKADPDAKAVCEELDGVGPYDGMVNWVRSMRYAVTSESG